MMEQDPGHILERRNSDNENLNPNPVIQTRKLSDYKIILPPKPIQPPTKRQVRDAGRCRRAGMVPGAIRKYLLQKKKHETTDAEDDEEEEEEDQDLEPVSDAEDEVDADVDANANVNVNAEDEEPDDVAVAVAATAERHRRCRGHCCEARPGRKNQDREECRGGEDEDDEVAIVGEFRAPHILGEVNSDNSDRGGARVNGSAAASNGSPDSDSGQDDFCPEDDDQPESNNNNSNKRRHSEAFTASPDTTTPDITTTPTPSTSRTRMSPHLEIESSPVILEYEHEQSPSAKRSRLETTPNRSRRSGRRGGRSQSPAGGTSSDTTDQEPGRVARSKKSRKGGLAGIEPESPGDNHSCRRKILQPDKGPRFTQAPEDPDLEKKVRKNVWKDVITVFNTNLEKNLVPSPAHVGDLIKKAILGLGTRVAKDIPAAALDFVGKLTQKYPVSSGGDETREYYSSAFTHTQTSSDKCTLSEFLFDVLDRVQADAQARVQSKLLPFFKLLTKMVVQQYKEYDAGIVKLRQPFFVQFLEEQDRILSYNFFCKKLVHFSFLLKNYPEEFKFVMRWVGLLAYHLKKNSGIDKEFNVLVEDFVETLAKPEHSSSTCDVVEAISHPSLGIAVSFKIIVNRIQFESARNSAERPSDSEIAEYLLSLAKSDSIAGLKSELQDRRDSNSTDFYPTLPISSLVAATVNKNGRGGNKSSETPAVNLRGEAYLHKLCRKEATVNGGASGSGGNNSSGLQLADLLRRKHFQTVNPTDNFGNTPLHDAIAHGRFDAVTKFYEHCSDVDLPEELRVNVLAQNKMGDTPFHLAAISLDQSEQMSRMLIFMAEKLQVKEEALKTLNQQGKMPFELAFNAGARSLLKPHALEEWIFQLGDVYVNPSRRTQLQSLEIKKLILFWSDFSQRDK